MRKQTIVFTVILFICTAVILSFSLPMVFSAGRFTDNGDGTLTDHELGLMWAKTDNRLDVSWQGANWYCNMGPPDIVGKYKGWRMPTVDELKSLYVSNPNYRGYTAACGQRVRIAPEIRLSCGQVWCYERGFTSATVFSFTDGLKYSEKKSAVIGLRALPVRTLKSGEF